MVSLSKAQVFNGLCEMGVASSAADLFLQYHSQRPQIWRAFEATALHLLASRGGDFGAKEVFENLRRGNEELPTIGEFKLDNNFTAMYARVFVLFHPEYKARIKLKKARGYVEAENEPRRTPFAQRSLQLA
jgi:hypothetical protein